MVKVIQVKRRIPRFLQLCADDNFPTEMYMKEELGQELLELLLSFKKPVLVEVTRVEDNEIKNNELIMYITFEAKVTSYEFSD